jgi:hypothetical protein
MKKFSLLLVLFASGFIFIGCGAEVPAPKKMVTFLPENGKKVTQTKQQPLCEGKMAIAPTKGSQVIEIPRGAQCAGKDLVFNFYGKNIPAFTIRHKRKDETQQQFDDRWSDIRSQSSHFQVPSEELGNDKHFFYKEELAKGYKNLKFLLDITGMGKNPIYVSYQWVTVRTQGSPILKTGKTFSADVDHHLIATKKLEITAGKDLHINMQAILTQDIETNYSFNIYWMLHKDGKPLSISYVRSGVSPMRGPQWAMGQGLDHAFSSETLKQCQDGSCSVKIYIGDLSQDLHFRQISYSLSWVDPQ